MKRWSLGVLGLLAGAVLLTSPAVAKSTVSCKQIRAAIASGKSVDDVASQFKVSTSKVNHCMKPTAKKGSSSTHSTTKQ
jgi:hypothetical protein